MQQHEAELGPTAVLSVSLTRMLILIIKDIRFGVSARKSFGQILSIFPYRCAEYLGLRDGLIGK